MPQPEPNLWFAAFVFSGAVASLATWLFLAQRRLHGPFLAYLPRRPVPWGPVATIQAILLVTIAIASLYQSSEWIESEFTTMLDLAQRIILGMLQMLLLTGVILAIVVGTARPTIRDLGLPEYTDELGRDVLIGVVACLAALVPVFAIQTVMIEVVGEPSQHPLVQMVLKERHPLVMALSFLAAVVVAPVCEEIAFRLFLQGWLEKWEDRRVNRPTGGEPPELEETEEEETRGQGDKESDATDSSPCLPVSLSPCLPPNPPPRGLFGLPHGWVPILISSVMFSLAHLGHGSDPVPLMLLAIILGYTYQRTHHIVPCIVTHMVFNLMTLIALGLQIYAS